MILNYNYILGKVSHWDFNMDNKPENRIEMKQTVCENKSEKRKVGDEYFDVREDGQLKKVTKCLKIIKE